MYKEVIIADLTNAVASGEIDQATADKVRAYMDSPEGEALVEDLDHSNADIVNAMELVFCLGA